MGMSSYAPYATTRLGRDGITCTGGIQRCLRPFLPIAALRPLAYLFHEPIQTVEGAAMADPTIEQRGKHIRRRGILAAAAAVVAGIVAKQASVPVAAAHYNLQGDTGLTFYNLANDRTLIFATGPFPASTPVLDVEVTGSDLTLGGDLAVGRVCGASPARRASRGCTAPPSHRERGSGCSAWARPRG